MVKCTKLGTLIIKIEGEKKKDYPWAVSETPVASVIRRPPLDVLWE